MTNKLKYFIFFTVLVLTLGSCKKVETIAVTKEQGLFNQATAFLKQKKALVTPHQSRKIDTLISNLLNRNVRKFKAGKTEVLICDLKTYKNVPITGYDHTYYKAYFQFLNGKIADAYIYTIHTNLSEEQLNSDIENVILIKSESFTGKLVTNAINDQFILGANIQHGELENIYEVKTKPYRLDGQVNNLNTETSNNVDDCSHFYLVTTTYFADGHIERDWQYLYSICGPCNTGGQPVSYLVPDCDPQGGGGGYGNYADTTNPCANADSLVLNAGYKSRLDSLKALSTQNFETGYYSIKNLDGSFTYHKQQGSAGNPFITGSNSITTPISSYMHNHYTGLLSVFSGGDLQQMYYWLKNGMIDDPSTFSMSLVTASGTTYMLQIDDITKFQQFGQTWMGNEAWFTLFEYQYLSNFGISETASNNNNISGFLRLLSEYNTGLKFFVGDINTFSQWTPKAFESDGSPTGGTIINSPCN